MLIKHWKLVHIPSEGPFEDDSLLANVGCVIVPWRVYTFSLRTPPAPPVASLGAKLILPFFFGWGMWKDTTRWASDPVIRGVQQPLTVRIQDYPEISWGWDWIPEKPLFREGWKDSLGYFTTGDKRSPSLYPLTLTECFWTASKYKWPIIYGFPWGQKSPYFYRCKKAPHFSKKLV